MLKNSISLYRCIILRACERLEDKTHARTLGYMNSKRTCGVECVTSYRVFHTGTLLRKKVKIRIPSLKLRDSKSTEPMSDLQPSSYNVSCGGTSTDNNPVENWRQGPSQETKVEEDWTKQPLNNLRSSYWRQTSEASNSTQDTENHKPCVKPSDFRIWETIDSIHAKGLRFKVMSYNVLAQYLLECHPYLYAECTPSNLKWKVRAARLFDEIINLSPDILCLQEVQASHLSSFYSKFEQMGYIGIFKQKTGQRQDGCAIYFKQALFKLQDHISVEYHQPIMPILNRDNIGLIVKLLPSHYPGSPIVVATTHLLYNPKRTDVRLAQMQVFLAEIDRFAYYNGADKCGHFPIILTGDFNSTPESAVIYLLDQGHVSATPFRYSSDWKRIGVTDNCQHFSVYLNRQWGLNTDYSNLKIYNSEHSESLPDCKSGYHHSAIPLEFGQMFNSGIIQHSLLLKSVYSKYKLDGTQEASTFQDYWVTVDYMYFSHKGNLRLVERLRLPSVPECELLGRLPNSVYGSDHLALAATFELTPTNLPYKAE